MATSGFWPVRGHLKKVLDYADNPDKTTEKKFLDDDLYAALRYTENDGKTDERKYVSGVNCSAAFAYEEMTAVKRRFGERGKVIAYHGFQSFQAGEVTPEQAHEIGLQQASQSGPPRDRSADSFCEQGSACGNHNRDHRAAKTCQACPAHSQGHAAPAEPAEDRVAGRIRA